MSYEKPTQQPLNFTKETNGDKSEGLWAITHAEYRRDDCDYPEDSPSELDVIAEDKTLDEKDAYFRDLEERHRRTREMGSLATPEGWRVIVGGRK